MAERLQKVLAGMGVASRRKCEEYILAGLVKVNGKVITKLGTKVDPDKDKIEVNQKEIAKHGKVVYMLHKPVGVITSCRKKPDEKIVLDLVPKKPRVFPIGRLDKDSSGLLLLTNDGELANKLTHPRYEKEKEYKVSVDEILAPGQVAKLTRGVTLFGVKTKKSAVVPLGKRRFSITLTEGKNRQIRRMCRKVGLAVTHLKRVRVARLELGNLPSGKYRKLTQQAISLLI